MNIVTKIKEISIASLLLITLMLPSGIQFSHELEEDHEFTLCHEQEEHIHELNVHCDLCSFHFSSYVYNFTSYPALDVPPIISKTTLGVITPLCYQLSRSTTQLRAPPVFS